MVAPLYKIINKPKWFKSKYNINNFKKITVQESLVK